MLAHVGRAQRWIRQVANALTATTQQRGGDGHQREEALQEDIARQLAAERPADGADTGCELGGDAEAVVDGSLTELWAGGRERTRSHRDQAQRRRQTRRGSCQHQQRHQQDGTAQPAERTDSRRDERES